MSDDRTARSIEAQVRRAIDAGELDLPEPGHGDTVTRWAALATLGRHDLALGRVAEGHADAVSILREADRPPEPSTLYGVWASKAGGGATLRDGTLSGTVRFCSGANSVDHALVAATTVDGKTDLVEVDMRQPGIRRDGSQWQAVGMAASDNADVTFDAVPVDERAIIGPPDFYTERRGFWWGGGGVAAVWWGGCAGVVDDVEGVFTERKPDEHNFAHLGALHTASRAARALLDETAKSIDADPLADVRAAVWACRSAVEALAREVLDRAPRMTGPGPLAWHVPFGRRLADLQLYVRQHHGERDLADLGRLVFEGAL